MPSTLRAYLGPPLSLYLRQYPVDANKDNVDYQHATHSLNNAMNHRNNMSHSNLHEHTRRPTDKHPHHHRHLANQMPGQQPAREQLKQMLGQQPAQPIRRRLHSSLAPEIHGRNTLQEETRLTDHVEKILQPDLQMDSVADDLLKDSWRQMRRATLTSPNGTSALRKFQPQ